MEPDELPAAARAVLDLARGADDPTAADRARIDAALSTKLQALGLSSHPPADPTRTGVHPASSGTSAASAARGASLKLGLGLSGAGMLAAGVWFGVQLVTPDSPAQPLHAPAMTAPSATQPAAPAVPGLAAAAPPLVASHATEAAPSDALPAPLPAHTATRASGTHAVGVGRLPSTAAEDSLRAEVTMIEGADQALRLGQPEKALRLLSRHAAQFARGSLTEEREGLRVLALCALGYVHEGREAKHRFLQAAPRSVLADRVRQACESSPPGKTAAP